MGTIIGVKELVDLRFSKNEIVKNVPTQYIRAVHRFEPDTYVVLN